MTWHRRALLTLLFVGCLGFMAATTDATVNPKSIWGPQVGLLLLGLAVVFAGVLWHGDDQ